MRAGMTWTQNYDPFGSALLSPLAAAISVVLLVGLLASGRVSAPVASGQSDDTPLGRGVIVRNAASQLGYAHL